MSVPSSSTDAQVMQDLQDKLQARTARIAVLMGGMSAERAVSMKSGKAVAEALRSRGWQVIEVDVQPDLPLRLALGGFQNHKYNLINKQNHDYNFRKTRKRKLLGSILCMDHFN
jgi:hypothetical protein